MRPTSILIAAAAGLAGADAAQAQSRFLFSVDWQGPTVGTPDPSGTPITEGDIMAPTTGTSLPALGPLPTPSIVIPATGLGLPGVCVGHPGGTPCVVDVDAFSRGGDAYFQPNLPIRDGQVVFSVDEFAYGTGTSTYFSVDTEFPVGNGGADTFTNQFQLSPAPVPPMLGMNTFMSDGDGMTSASGAMYPGIGLIEPNGPLAGLPTRATTSTRSTSSSRSARRRRALLQPRRRMGRPCRGLPELGLRSCERVLRGRCVDSGRVRAPGGLCAGQRPRPRHRLR